MKIHIEDYRNIDNLDYEIEDGKVNFLYGLCGSGKSSILTALSGGVEESDLRVGASAESPVVKINGGEPDKSSVRLFNSDRQGLLFSPSSSGEYYDIFVGSTEVLREKIHLFNEAIEELRFHLPSLYSYKEQLAKVAGAMGKPDKRSGKYGGASKLLKMVKEVSNASPYAYAVMSQCTYDHITWKIKGFSISEQYSNSCCPFCGRKIDEELKGDLDQLRELNSSALKPLYESANTLENLGLPAPTYTDEDSVGRFKRELEKCFIVEREIDWLIEYCKTPRSLGSMDAKFNPVLLSDKFYEKFPALRSVVQRINGSNNRLKQIVGLMRGAFVELLGSGAADLNRKLKQLGIPYEFEIPEADFESKQASYVLRHIEAPEGVDMRGALSTGERNLIALLLFLREPARDLVLIDDPASSYDDYRRSQIFEAILNGKGTTILVVSHDQAFVKRAVRAKSSRIGKVQMMTHGKGGYVFSDIGVSDFGWFGDFVSRRMKSSTSYYQRVVNLRLLADIEKANLSQDAWGYLSALLHGKTREAIMAELSKRGTTEECVVREINNALDADLALMEDDYFLHGLEGLSDFEQLIVQRESLRLRNSNTGLQVEENMILETLNDLVHMNDACLVCLDPYRFNVWPCTFDSLLGEAGNM